MMQTYTPPMVDVAQDTPPELAPIFSYLNSHSNKLYQEGYFLKLHDLDSRGRPSVDRTWTECFAQLVGTVLSLWDAAALDAAGEDGEVVPSFVNLSDASIKMIESLPMNGAQGGSLQNVLSISTAANNRYLLHFNSLNSLTQWTAGIRLAMFEHATLQEAYTGSLIAGKGKHLNNIKAIMERSKFAHEDWARVRFGAGTPWKRCWCVVSQPDEKDYQKAMKEQTKTLKKGAYDRKVTIPKGDIKFYDTRKVTKKTQPIATITDAYAVYAIYPQSKPLIDQSTLVKLEGLVTIHTTPESTTEGFVFIMPEVHAAVSGFEMMMRWLFPVWDTFCLYGRPNKLVADTLDQRGLMFAMPRDRRYGYLDILDVSGLIHTQGSQAWSERQWRNQLKKLTSTRMNSQSAGEDSPGGLRQMGQRRNTTSRTSLSGGRPGVKFGDESPSHSGPPSRTGSPVGPQYSQNSFSLPRRTDSAPNGQMTGSPHKRSASDAMGYRKFQSETPSRLSYEQSRPSFDETPPAPPRHNAPYSRPALNTIASEAEIPTVQNTYEQMNHQNLSPNMMAPQPVLTPPAMTHNPNSRPANQPYQAPELRRAHSNVDAATLQQMQDATRRDDSDDDNNPTEEQIRQRVATLNRTFETPADHSQGLVTNPPRDTSQTLPTIEASPMVGSESETFSSLQAGGVGIAAGIAGMGAAALASQQSQSDGSENSASRPGLPVPVRSSHSITRKPVPRSTSTSSIPAPETSSEKFEPQTSLPDRQPSPASSHHGSLRGLIDQDALDRYLGGDDNDHRNNTMISHASSTTPDYASTASVSTRPEDRPSYERPRAGKLKTVGDPNLLSRDVLPGRFDTWEQQEQAAKQGDMSAIDFGPTLTYKPTSRNRPGTSGTMTPGNMTGDRNRSRSADRLRESSKDWPGSGSRPQTRLSPGTGEAKRQSYFDLGRTTPSGARSPSGNTPGDRNAIAWEPQTTSPVLSTRQSMTAEQWVAHRASQAALTQQPPHSKHPHNRQSSANKLQTLRQNSATPPLNRTLSGDWTHHPSRQTSKTPPLDRTLSGDWTQNRQHPSRQTSKTPPLNRTLSGDWTQHRQTTPPTSRPNSRGAGAYLSQHHHGSSGQLSAKEQMYVARATGTPMLPPATSKQQQQEHENFGLVGGIAAREREKAEAKKGLRGSRVEAEIAARQLQQQQQQQALMMQQQGPGQQQQFGQQWDPRMSVDAESALYGMGMQQQGIGNGTGYGDQQLYGQAQQLGQSQYGQQQQYGQQFAQPQQQQNLQQHGQLQQYAQPQQQYGQMYAQPPPQQQFSPQQYSQQPHLSFSRSPSQTLGHSLSARQSPGPSPLYSPSQNLSPAHSPNHSRRNSTRQSPGAMSGYGMGYFERQGSQSQGQGQGRTPR
ncbi:hypothetical protein MBLNU230_g3800t1 [Neophaeotheca triangularis]